MWIMWTHCMEYWLTHNRASSSSFLFAVTVHGSNMTVWSECTTREGYSVDCRGRRSFYLPFGTELCFGEELGLQSPLSDTSPGSPWHQRREVLRACRRDLQRNAWLRTDWWWREEGVASWTSSSTIFLAPPAVARPLTLVFVNKHDSQWAINTAFKADPSHLCQCKHCGGKRDC